MTGLRTLKYELKLSSTEFSSLLHQVSRKAVEGSFAIGAAEIELQPDILYKTHSKYVYWYLCGGPLLYAVQSFSTLILSDGNTHPLIVPCIHKFNRGLTHTHTRERERRNSYEFSILPTTSIPTTQTVHVPSYVGLPAYFREIWFTDRSYKHMYF